MNIESLDVQDFADLFGISIADLPQESLELISVGDWRYWKLEGKEFEDVVLDFLQRIENRNFSFVVKGDKDRWIKGWGENLEDFVASGGQEEALYPKYIRPRMPMRLNGRFIRSLNHNLELDWFRVFQQWMFREYMKPFDNIVELGCGSGINVAAMAEMYPEKKIIGCDWAEPSVQIVEEMRKLRGWNTEGRVLDFFNPDTSWGFEDNTVVYAAGALEQTGTDHDAIIDWIIERKPALCVFVEPIMDWYDPNNLVDHLAIQAHKLRNFWQGFPERLKQMEAEGKAEIIKEKRSNFGSLVLEGYSQLIWRPL